jgi:hypothetical protein
MKNRELIATLQQLPPDADVWMTCEDHGAVVLDRAELCWAGNPVTSDFYAGYAINLMTESNYVAFRKREWRYKFQIFIAA